jgi:hypothetical protein
MPWRRWLDEQFDAVSFRLRLARLAVRRLDHIPAEVVMALEPPDQALPVLGHHEDASDFNAITSGGGMPRP